MALRAIGPNLDIACSGSKSQQPRNGNPCPSVYSPKMKDMKRIVLFVFVAVLVSRSSAAGQTTSAPQSPDDPLVRVTLPSVTVTAQKEPEDARKLPVSVTAVSADTIDRAGIRIVSEAGDLCAERHVHRVHRPKAEQSHGSGGSGRAPVIRRSRHSSTGCPSSTRTLRASSCSTSSRSSSCAALRARSSAGTPWAGSSTSRAAAPAPASGRASCRCRSATSRRGTFAAMRLAPSSPTR